MKIIDADLIIGDMDMQLARTLWEMYDPRDGAPDQSFDELIAECYYQARTRGIELN